MRGKAEGTKTAASRKLVSSKYCDQTRTQTQLNTLLLPGKKNLNNYTRIFLILSSPISNMMSMRGQEKSLLRKV